VLGEQFVEVSSQTYTNELQVVWPDKLVLFWRGRYVLQRCRVRHPIPSEPGSTIGRPSSQLGCQTRPQVISRREVLPQFLLVAIEGAPLHASRYLEILLSPTAQRE
jgi:hypothetical protein